MAMSIGAYELTHYPSGFTIPKPERSNAYLPTMASVAHFSWGFFWPGKIIEIEWNYMPSVQFDSLDAVFQGDVEVEWDPGIPGISDTYTVQILNFTGDFHEAVGTEAEIWRRNCKMTLLILAVNESS